MNGPTLDGLRTSDAGAALAGADLSPWFNPFLEQFARESRRCGGEVRVVREGASIRALYVSDPVERVGTVFSRSRELAEGWVRERGSIGLFAEYSFDPAAEAFDILSIALHGRSTDVRFHHPVRSLRPDDISWVVPLMREVYGKVNERWFEGLPSEEEVGFVSEVGGRPVGVGWASRAGRHARVHSLTVRAPFRHMGIGSDLLAARILWARRMGCGELLSEIARDNTPSQLIALRAGMQRVGEIYFHRPR